MNGDFNRNTDRTLAKRAGERCSICGTGTSQPHTDSDKFTNLGEAAHIRGKKEGRFNRYDVNMSDEERSAISNGIWLCRTCHKKIDSDDIEFTVEKLMYLKEEHEKKVKSGYYNQQYPNYAYTQKIEHDRNVFAKSDQIFSELQLKELISKLKQKAFIFLDDENLISINQFIEFHNSQGNEYIHEELKKVYAELRFVFNTLLLHLYDIEEKDKMLFDDNFMRSLLPKKYFIGMQPAPKATTNILIPISAKIQYENNYWQYSKKLGAKLQNIESGYGKYRQTIKNLLFK